MPDNTISQIGTDANAKSSAVALQKWGGVASFLMAAAFIVAPLIYLTGNLRAALGPLTYDLADFLYGPLWAASLVTAVFALRERIGGSAQRRMTLSLLAAVLAAGAMVAVACIRSANRHYHIDHPELHLEESATVLVVWTTLLAGLTSAGWHFLGWSFVLIGSAGWSTRRLPRLLSLLYL
jgi:hypothetical protein